MTEKTLMRGGRINYKTDEDGGNSPYELNINYLDGLSDQSDDDQTRIQLFLASQCLLLSLIGVPAIYIHSLLVSPNDYEGMEKSGINRRINLEKLLWSKIDKELSEGGFRKEVLFLDPRVFVVRRYHKEMDEQITVIINVSTDSLELDSSIKGVDLASGEKIENGIAMKGLQYRLIKSY